MSAQMLHPAVLAKQLEALIDLPPALPVLRPHRELAARHIELLTGDPGASLCFRMFGGSYPQGRNLNGTLAQVWDEIVAGQEQGAQVFVLPNAGGHTDAEITAIRPLFIDMDGKLLPDSWHVEPDFDFLVIRDDTHWHAYWLVQDMDVGDFKAAQRRLAAYYGSDPTICNPSRVMRLAGSIHTKLPPHGDGIARLVTVRVVGDRPPAFRAWPKDLLAGLPAAIARKPVKGKTGAASIAREPLAPGCQVDAEHVIERGRRYLRGVVADDGAPVEGSRNAQCVKLANALGDFGLSERAVTLLLTEEWAAHGRPPDEAIGDIVASAFRSRAEHGNAIGSDYISGPPRNSTP
jgi:hypothetical protein